MKLRSVSPAVAALAAVLLLVSVQAAVAQRIEPPSADVAPSPGANPAAPEGGGGPGPITTGFTYQGQLTFNSGPVNNSCDFQFSLWDQSGSGAPPSGGTQLGSMDSQTGVSVSKGLFTVVLNAGSQFGDLAFQTARWLQIAVRCPPDSGYTILSPRQPLWAAPYAMGLRPGTMIRGTAYQVVKIQSDAPTGSIPATVTGEMMSALDGVGVYGSNNSTATGSAGAGVWGRSYNLAGAGVKGTGLNGSAGVYGEAVANGGIGVRAASSGNGLGSPALFAEATSTKADTPAGIAIYAKNHGGDSTIVAQNTGAGDYYRALNAGNYIVYRVTSTGRVVTSAVEIYGGGDLAERFEARDGAQIEPGTLMVIDEAHPGALKPSASAYDPKVAGIVSGAGGVDPGLTLQQNGVMEGNTVVALAGRVYVKAEAVSAPIKPGDLLTSSAIPGTAMKASDRALSQGAVIGKAMSGLDSGQGLVLVLVNLQ
jgi:hypothetical protein